MAKEALLHLQEKSAKFSLFQCTWLENLDSDSFSPNYAIILVPGKENIAEWMSI